MAKSRGVKFERETGERVIREMRKSERSTQELGSKKVPFNTQTNKTMWGVTTIHPTRQRTYPDPPANTFWVQPIERLWLHERFEEALAQHVIPSDSPLQQQLVLGASYNDTYIPENTTVLCFNVEDRWYIIRGDDLAEPIVRFKLFDNKANNLHQLAYLLDKDDNIIKDARGRDKLVVVIDKAGVHHGPKNAEGYAARMKGLEKVRIPFDGSQAQGRGRKFEAYVILELESYSAYITATLTEDMSATTEDYATATINAQWGDAYTCKEIEDSVVFVYNDDGNYGDLVTGDKVIARYDKTLLDATGVRGTHKIISGPRYTNEIVHYLTQSLPGILLQEGFGTNEFDSGNPGYLRFVNFYGPETHVSHDPNAGDPVADGNFEVNTDGFYKLNLYVLCSTATTNNATSTTTKTVTDGGGNTHQAEVTRPLGALFEIDVDDGGGFALPVGYGPGSMLHVQLAGVASTSTGTMVAYTNLNAGDKFRIRALAPSGHASVRLENAQFNVQRMGPQLVLTE